MKRLLLVLFAAAVAATAQPTPKFPASVVTWQDIYLAKDDSRSVLTDQIDFSSLAIPVADGSKFSPWEIVTIQGERILLCSIDANTLYACSGGRGFDGTSPVLHAPGIAVMGLNTAVTRNVLAAELKAIEEALGPNLSNVTVSSIAWGSVTGKPTTFAPSAHTHTIADLTTVGDYSSLITVGTYGISVTGSAGSVAWADITGKPASFGAPPDGSDYDIQLKSGTDFTHINGFNWLSGTFNIPGLLNVTPPALAQSYSNPGGTGDRRLLITATSNTVTWQGSATTDASFLLDSVTASGGLGIVYSSGAASGAQITFDFGGAYIVTEAKLYQSGTNTDGNFKWQGSNDNSAYTDLTAQFVLGGATVQTMTNLNGNVNAYRYYRLQGVSGTAGLATLREIEFQLGSNALTLPAGTVHGSMTFDGYVKANNFQGSGSALTPGTVPIAAIVGGAAKIANAYTHDASWSWTDPYLALPTGNTNVQWVLWPRAASLTVASVVCTSDDAAATIQLRRSDAVDFISSNLTCNGTQTTGFTANNTVATNQYAGFYVIAGAAKRVTVAITYTTSY